MKSIKFLTIVVVGAVILLVLNTRKVSETSPESADPNNLNSAIASQFNDNIRDVSARLQETEKKLKALENKPIPIETQQIIKSEIPADLIATVEGLKEEIATLKIHPPVPELPKESPKPKPKKIVVPKSIPYYTIPAGSDLANTTLMSALIGEVPVEGKLMQPLFPFTAIVSRGDLMASNGVPLPNDIAGMKVSGYAIGVGSFLDNIACVRAYVTSLLFTFADGHFVTVGHEQMTSTTDLVNNESLGYLTNPYGNPCIHGKYFTNAPRVLAAMLAAGGVQGFGEAVSQWQMSYTSGVNGTMASPTGSFLPFAAGHATSEGSIKAADWLEKRIQGSFDMVFVPASIGRHLNHVSLHITQTITIDKETKGRQLNHAHLQATIHDLSLR